MALKKKLTAEAYDALEEAQKSLYIKSGEGYALDLDAGDDDDEDVSAEIERLDAKRRLESEHRKKAEKKARELQQRLDELEDQHLNERDEGARKSGDVAALDASWKAKEAKLKADHEAMVNQYQTAINELLVDQKAVDIATRISSSPDLLAPIVKQRLKVEYIDGKPETRVVDATGQLSAASLEDLEKEIAGDKRYASVIIASNGSGGGSRGNRAGGGTFKEKKFSELSEKERVDWYKEDPQGFAEASRKAAVA